MKVLVDIGHPAHVHLFKNMIWNLEEDGHEVKITARDKEAVLYLLDAYRFKYENLGKHHKKAPFGCKSVVALAKHWVVPIR